MVRGLRNTWSLKMHRDGWRERERVDLITCCMRGKSKNERSVDLSEDVEDYK